MGSALLDVCLSSSCGPGSSLNMSIALPQDLEQVLPISGLIMTGRLWKVLANGLVHQTSHGHLASQLEVVHLVASPF